MSGVSLPNGVSINKRAVFWGLGGVSAIVYLLFVWILPTFIYNNAIHKPASWKTRPFVQIPIEVKKRLENAAVAEMELSFTMDDKRLSIFYRESLPWHKKEKCQTVVLLHGAGDSSQWWKTIGTFQLLSASGYHVYGLDLPGWGDTKTDVVSDPGVFLTAFFRELDIVRPVIVAASMGGQYVLPFMLNPRAATCDSRMAGFVPIAIVGTDRYKPIHYNRCLVPSMIVYGTKDTNLGLFSVGDLRNLGNHEIYPMEKAGHACVRERPDEWHHILYNFLIQAVPADKCGLK